MSMTDQMNVVYGLKLKWDESWDEDPVFEALQNASKGFCGLIKGDDDDPHGYFGFILCKHDSNYQWKSEACIGADDFDTVTENVSVFLARIRGYCRLIKAYDSQLKIPKISNSYGIYVFKTFI